MKLSRDSTPLRILIPLLLLGLLSGCFNDDTDDNDPVADNNPPVDVAPTIQIDATAGGFGADPNDPANKYTYFNLESGQVISITDNEAETSENWHIAFKRTNVKLNGGASGPASIKGAVADAQDGFYDGNGEPDSSVFSNATAANELAAFAGVANTDGLVFVEDRNIPYIQGDGSSEGWWLYNPQGNTVSANPDQWWLIKSAAANSYAKFNVTNIVQVSRDITLDLYIQGAAANAFSTTATPWTATIGAADGSRCFDIDDAVEVDCTTAIADWDLKVEIDGQAWNIWTNGTLFGSGNGGAFGPFDTAGIADYVSGTASASGTDISGMYEQDSTGGIFKDNTWYAYNILNQRPPLLWPNYRVYAVDTGSGFFKLQLLSYYNQAGISGNYTVRYAPLTGADSAEIVTVALTEWAVTPDKTTVNAGTVIFNVTNDGPIDVHEFVVIKTDLAPDSLPVNSDGNVDESGAGITLIGEIEDIAVGADAQTTFDLEAGNYVLICNIWDVGEQEAHYAEGMRVAFTVQ